MSDDISSDKFYAFEIADGGILSGIDSRVLRVAFSRILRALGSSGDSGASIPALWKPYHYNSYISFQAAARLSGETGRILIDRRSYGPVVAVCQGVMAKGLDFQSQFPVEVDSKNIAEKFKSALEYASCNPSVADSDCFELPENDRLLGYSGSLDVWFESKLTASQRAFVKQPVVRSLRVRGPAGSGKTVALVVKMLRYALEAADRGDVLRLALLTHSQATVDSTRSLIKSMINDDQFEVLFGEAGSIYLGTLYSKSYRALGVGVRGVEPLSLDGVEGREMQAEMLHSVVKSYIKGDWLARRGGCSVDFVSLFEAAASDSNHGNSFISEILFEFACVIEPEGFYKSARRRAEYVSKMPRDSWRMRLQQEDERRVILDLHDAFRSEMRGAEAMTVDQLVSDFDRFLDSNAWDLTRSVEGFDVIFVDELHLMNRLERMVINSLMRSSDQPPLIVMAEDIKQDIRRMGQGLGRWKSDLSEIGEFRLTEVFRYSPQINALVIHMDSYAPTVSLKDDWPDHDQKSLAPPGELPSVRVFGSEQSQFDHVFESAARSARKRKVGRSVAVLCCDYEQFNRYAAAGKYRDSFVAISSREEIGSIPSKGVKFVLSMPEFVAGLQFEEVYLMDVNDNVLFPEDGRGVSDRRRGLATLYLGATRAIGVLHLTSCLGGGGLPAVIKSAMEAGICLGLPVE
ncbi:UvrD-helicase domain-containing protein [Stenotrophomonas sp. HMWF003]|uniref:UvrD-helicase domain-containing protein n=1 Tax=Stenotrophomonas sp. HMWF003 TaxID=2056840 RepID=UPI000FE201F7|nr:UvrD-helicase domain-containing protein [Stenotrophomonas sp. HMWF003]